MYRVTAVQRFCMHDGPGVRTTVFLKGCPLKCVWCHNPETRNAKGFVFDKTLCVGCKACAKACPSVHRFENGMHVIDASACTGRLRCVESCPVGALKSDYTEYSAQQLVAEALKDKPFYGDRGGVTLSGGEPMFRPEEALKLLRAFKAAGLNTAVETCGFFAEKYVEPLCRCADTVLWDVKDTDDKRHMKYTGVSCEPILSNLRRAVAAGANLQLRCILVQGINTGRDHMLGLRRLYLELGRPPLKFIPYHDMSSAKYESMGLKYPGHSEWIPDAEEWKKRFYSLL